MLPSFNRSCIAVANKQVQETKPKKSTTGWATWSSSINCKSGFCSIIPSTNLQRVVFSPFLQLLFARNVIVVYSKVSVTKAPLPCNFNGTKRFQEMVPIGNAFCLLWRTCTSLHWRLSLQIHCRMVLYCMYESSIDLFSIEFVTGTNCRHSSQLLT